MYLVLLVLCLAFSLGRNLGYIDLPGNVDAVLFIVWIALIWTATVKVDVSVNAFLYTISAFLLLGATLLGGVGLQPDGSYDWGYLFLWNGFYIVVAAIALSIVISEYRDRVAAPPRAQPEQSPNVLEQHQPA